MGELYSFTVNGNVYETAQDKPLLRFLRDDLGLRSVKDGCSEGACGTCTIIVDGKAVRSCVLSTKRAAGDGGAQRKGERGLRLRLWRDGFRSVRLLHPRDGDGRQGAYRP